MEKHIPQPVFLNEEVYIIGGGPSLKDFDWSLLRGLNTIGCNDAYTLGSEICNCCIFGDIRWWEKHKEALENYNGEIYCIEPRLFSKQLPERIKHVRRYASGLQIDGVGWNGNTGFAAINLAILFGSKKIYLLGFDMKRQPISETERCKKAIPEKTRSNWHKNNLDNNPDSVYKKFLHWADFVERDWHEKFWDVQIFNITDDSALEIFPKISLKEFFLKRESA